MLVNVRSRVETFIIPFPMLLEVFDAARHAEPIALSLLLYRSDKGFGYALGIDAAPEAIRL